MTANQKDLTIGSLSPRLCPNLATPDPIPLPPDPFAEQDDAEESIPDLSSTLVRVDRLAVQALELFEELSHSGDYRGAVSAIREVRATLELVARLRGEIQQAALAAVQVNVSNAAASADADLDASLEGLMAQVRQRTNTAPVCGACGEPCSACASELAGISHRRPALALEQPALDVEVIVDTPAEAPESPAQPPRAVRPAVVPQGVTEPHKGRDDGPNAQLVRQDGGWRL